MQNVRCCIPEFKVDLEKLIDLLSRDKRENPSNYAIVILSEGAQWEGYETREYGEADAFGHRKKTNVAEDLSEEVKKRTKDETVVSDLTYELRSGTADFMDSLVASRSETWPWTPSSKGRSGLMTGIADGCFTMAGIPDPKLGPRSVDLTTQYDTEQYRPHYAHKAGIPVFLTRA